MKPSAPPLTKKALGHFASFQAQEIADLEYGGQAAELRKLAARPAQKRPADPIPAPPSPPSI